jgi:hypothetical protein
VAESWFALSPEDQTEALAVAAAESGWPANLLEKDIWVVWALQTLGAERQLLETLTFKGGTSLSKAYGLIDRFSEDVPQCQQRSPLGLTRPPGGLTDDHATAL